MKLIQKLSPARRVRRAAAFTLIEIALSLAVISFALVAIIGILPTGLTVQKENREETLINFEAGFLMDAIRSGSRGQENLTNYVMAITNRFYHYNFNPTGTNLDTTFGTGHFNYFTTNEFYLD